MQANFTKASLLVSETQLVARLLLERPSAERWREAIELENILQTKTVNTAKSYATIARMRLETMGEQLWEMAAFDERPVATQAVMACALKFSPLMAEFMRTALRDEYRRMSGKLEDRVWRMFLSDLMLNQAGLAQLSDSTQTKLRQNAHRMLSEAGYLNNTHAKVLQHVKVLAPIRRYLQEHNESAILAAMDCAH